MSETFAFVTHPLDYNGVISFEPKVAGKSPALVEKVMQWMTPFKLSEMTGIKSITGKEIKGYFVACPLLPKHFVEWDRKTVMDKIIQSGKVAEEIGAKIVGLGAYTSVAGDAGVTVANNIDIGVTTGTSYTVYSAIEALIRAAEILEVDIHKTTVCLVGATGAIGGAASHLLAEYARRLILVARNKRKLAELEETLKQKFDCEIETSQDVKESIQRSQLVMTATSTPFGLISTRDLRPGTIVCDVSRPRNVTEENASERPDVLVIDGGIIKVPGDNVDFHYDFGFPKNLAYACMSETMILALEGKFHDYSLGRVVDLQKVYEIAKLAEKHGFKLAGFRSFDRPVSEKDIEEVKRQRHTKKVSIA